MAELDTFPKILFNNASRIGNRAAVREKDLGIWQTWSWAQVAEQVTEFANGLASLGFTRGDKMLITGDNRPRLYWAIGAAQALRGIPVPTYQDSIAEEMRYVANHAEVRFAIAENQEQVDKLLEILEAGSTIEYIIYADDRGLADYKVDKLLSFDEVQRLGREFASGNPQYFNDMLASGEGSDTAVFLYTSGTTGRPKGVVLSQQSLLVTARNSIEFEGLTADEETLAYLPMAWVGDHLFSICQSYLTGFCVSCPESQDTVLENLREIGPTYYFAPPRVFENLLATVMIRMSDAAPLKQKMFHYFLDVAKRTGARLLDGERVGLGERLLYKLGDLLVYGPLKDALGMSRIRLAYTAGEAIGPEIFDFYRSLGVNIKQIYGQTEASVFVTIQPNGQVRADTVGVAAPEVEVRIDDSGEVMYKGPGVFEEYYKNEEATRSTKTDDGWVYTGDAGFFTDDGHLKIIDRAKDVGKFSAGEIFAPKYIENKLKFFPHIREAVVFGDNRECCNAFVNIDMEAVSNWAEKQGVSFASYQELAASDAVYEMIRESVESVNRDLAADSMLAHSQINRFLILHKELEADDGELTRTRKVRRPFIAEKYAPLIEGLYSDSNSAFIESKVTFEDGRIGEISADLKIRDAKTYDKVEQVA